MSTAGGRTKVAYFVPPSRHFAGVERVVHEIATGLAETCAAAFDVHVVFASAYDEPVLQDTAYTKHVLGVRRLRQLTTAIRSCVAANDFDVLVCPQVEPTVLTWLATRGLRLPVFLAHLHGNPRIEEERGSPATRLAFLLFRRLVSRRIAGVLVVSPSLERYTAASLTPHLPVRFVPNPVREFDMPERSPRADDVFRFVSVARLSYQKGQDVLLHAIALARPRLPPFRVTLVGSGPDEAELKALARELEVDDVVTFAGYTTDPVRYLLDADCFVLASRWEGFGVVLVEALRVGLPVLSTDCEFGPADVIVDPVLGHLVPPEDPQALAGGLVAAVGRPDVCDGVAHRRAAADRYSRSAVIAEHAAALQRFSPEPAAAP